MAKPSICFLANSTDTAQQSQDALIERYGQTDAQHADVIVALGGDGFMLQTQLDFMDSGKPVYGMNKGTVGFLMNEYREEDLHARLARALKATIHPLQMVAIDEDGNWLYFVAGD